MVVIYVDDFIGVHRCDYQVAELHNSFKWGSLAKMEVGTPTIFKGKELHLLCDQAGRYTMKITMAKFIQTLDVGQVQRGRLQQPPALTPSEQKELRSVSGCLQWAATQARPEIAPTVSLTPHGSEATIYDLKSLYGTIDFLKATPENGILIQDVAVNKNTVMVGYSDASWANAEKSGSQIGVVIGLTNQEALSEPSKFAVLDWKSSRSRGCVGQRSLQKLLQEMRQRIGALLQTFSCRSSSTWNQLTRWAISWLGFKPQMPSPSMTQC